MKRLLQLNSKVKATDRHTFEASRAGIKSPCGFEQNEEDLLPTCIPSPCKRLLVVDRYHRNEQYLDGLTSYSSKNYCCHTTYRRTEASLFNSVDWS